jgi:hypothetical protein
MTSSANAVAQEEIMAGGSKSSGGRNARWVVVAVGGFVLLVAVVIFSSAGPDRSRTTEYKDTIPSAVNPANGEGKTGQSPNTDMPTAPRKN